LSEYSQTVFDKFELQVRKEYRCTEDDLWVHVEDRKVKAESVGRVGKALEWARKYSLIANSIKPPILAEPRIESQS
jgi:hypothetical protein